MNLDFHVHGLLTKKSNFNETLFLQGIEIAKEQGLDGYILCEHFNSKDILEIYEYLSENYEYVGDKYIINGFSIFIGMEVDIKDGGHVIICGNRENIIKVREILEAYMVKPNFIEFEKLLSLGEQYNCLMIGSHPFRESHKLFMQPKSLLCRLHALDLNATDIFKRKLHVVREEVESLSNEINIPYITGSDSHYPMQIGSVKTKFEGQFNTVKEIIEAISEKKFEIEVSNLLDIKVFTAKTTKKYLKKKLSI